ncbi:MAG: hypothetical protein IJZ57_04410 [Clostridia bacterium]|nr:hypothetical protein [Clostridia bacterium]
MADFLSYISQHWYLVPVFVVLIGLTVFVWIKAIVSGQKRKEEREKIIAQLEKEKALRNQFRVLRESLLTDPAIDDERLIFGFAANVQMSIEKLPDMNEEFMKLNEVKQNIYALNYVFEDSKYTTLSDFFRANGEPLTSIAKRAVKDVIGGELAEIFSSQFVMLDDNNEDVSYDENKVNSLDSQYCDFMKKEKEAVLKRTSDYIRANFNAFI